MGGVGGTVAAVGLIGFGLAAALPAPAADARIGTLVFPPWWSQPEIWTAALAVGDIVDAGAWPFVLTLRREADLASRARQAGALLVLDSKGIGLCAGTTRSATR